MDNREVAIKISGVTKQYRLGQIGGGTLTHDLQSWWAKVRGKEDPNSKIGSSRISGETLMALNGINLTIYKGERVGITGRNGAGKSTLLKLLCRVTAPTSGSIDIYGRITSMLEVGTGFHGEMTGRENIYMNGAILGMKKSEIDRKMEDIIEFSEVREFIDTPVKRYSSGMFVKLAFSVAAHLDAEIMIMDEVLAVGDMKFQRKCLAKMRELAIDENRTVLYVSHNMSTIQELCSRCVVLDHGKKAFDGEVEEAIKLYLGGENDTFISFEYKDDSFKEPVRHHRVNLEKACFNGITSQVFYDDDKVPLELTWSYLEDVENMGLRFELTDFRRYPITAFVVQNLSGKKGERVSKRFLLDISALAQGRYYTRYVFFTRENDFAEPETVENAAGLVILKRLRTETGLRWQKVWGSVVSKGIEMIE